MALTAQTLVRCGVPAAKAQAHLPHMAAAMREHDITTPVRARMFIAQVMHESLALRYFEEIASGAAYEGRRDLGNVRPGDGRRFKGRGPIQLTGRANYTLFGKLLGLDLVGRPEIAATPRVGWRVAALYFERRGCNAAADRNDFRAVTRAINGGLNGYEDRVRYLKLLRGAGVVPGVPFLGRGDRGDAVVTMTRRLTFLGYLDGKRAQFDSEAEKALRRFQKDRELEVDGRLGPKSTTALARATAAEKQRRAKPREEARVPEKVGATTAGKTDSGGKSGSGGGRFVRGGGGGRTSEELLAGLDRLDARGDALRAALIRRHRALERAMARRRSLTPAELDLLRTALGKLDAVVGEVRAAIAAAEQPPALKVGDAVVTQATPESISALTDRLVTLDAEEDKIRALLADRFEDLEKLVVKPRRRARRKPPPRDRPEPIGAGARSFHVRQSKVALARLHRKTNPGLSRKLLREVRGPNGKLATQDWVRAVKLAQRTAGLPVTGALDPDLEKVLRRHWPEEAAMRRLVRATPAWRLIPGQLSPNFNLRELACNDGTAYVAGLVREQGLSKAQAKQRAKQLAARLERLRAREGNRPIRLNSAFRTKRHNAGVGGVPNSAHTRGFAVDIRPPTGVSVAAHHAHVRKVFEGGVGLYATFVHGDFAPEERGQNWTG